MSKKFIKAHIEKAGEKTYRFLASSSSVDRQGDVIDQKGWELKNFMKNPVILWAHRYDELPLGKVIELSTTENGLEAEIVFADKESNPKAQQVKRLVDEGYLNAVSVGFIAKERDENQITKSELLEISIVPVPANQDALIQASFVSDSLKSEIKSIIKKEEGGTIPDEIQTEAPEVEEDKPEEIIETEETPVTEEKSGRVISGKNRKALESTRKALESAISEIDRLLTMSEATTTENSDEKSELVVVSRSVLDELKYNLRHDNKKNEQILSTLKKL